MNPRKNIKAKQRRRARMKRLDWTPAHGRRLYLRRDESTMIEVPPGVYGPISEIFLKKHSP